MKKTTQLLFTALLLSLSMNTIAQETCGTYTYYTSNAVWSSSEWYNIINIDAGTLTDAALPKFTAAHGALNALETDFGTGAFTTPVMTTTDGTVYSPTSVLWPVKYKMAAFAPTMKTSAWSKVNVTGATPSGGGAAVACTLNDNSVKQSAIFDKPGFIELSRLAPSIAETTVSRHGSIEIDGLPQVERIQWSYSSTSWKRGVKMDIKYGDGEWQPQHWEPSDFSSATMGITTFSEQGYQFEEMIGKQDDPTSKISIRFRIWDGDSIHINPLKTDGSTYTLVNKPLSQYQTVRIHQIKVFSGVIPTEAPSAVQTVNADAIKIYLSDKNIILATEAKVEVYAVAGNRVYKGFTKKVDVSNLSRGIYIVKAIGINGRIQNTKIIL